MTKNPTDDADTNSTPFQVGETVKGLTSGCSLRILEPNDNYTVNPYTNVNISSVSDYTANLGWINLDTSALAAQALGAYSVCADDSDSPCTCESLTVSDRRKIRVPVLNLGLVALLGSGIKNVPLINPAGSVISFLSLTFALAPELCPTRISFGIGLPEYAPRA